MDAAAEEAAEENGSPPAAEEKLIRSNLSSLEPYFISLIRSSKSPLQLKQIHARLLRHRSRSLLTPRLAAGLVAAALAVSHPCSAVPYALAIARHAPPSSPLLDALVRALADASLPDAALAHFALFARAGLRPGRLAFPFALKSAAALPSPPHASALHAAAAKAGLDLDPFVRTSLVDMYVKLRLPDLSLMVFDDTPEWHKQSNVLLWNVSINGCCRSGDLEGARRIFGSMPERSIASWNSLIHGYMRGGNTEAALELFERMSQKNVVSWTTMISGFLQLEDYDQALLTFDKMLEAGTRGNGFTISSALAACARMGALERGIQIHDYALKNGFQMNGAIGTALVDMYSKCGNVELASQVFDAMKTRDLLTWTAMIMGWAVHGYWAKAIQCFEDMKCACVMPDEGVFLAVLMACSHSGKVDRGIQLFDSMRFDYKIEPTIKHFTCMVDLFGRAGRLDEAVSLMETMPIEPDYVLWGALFNACRAHKNVELAELAAEKLLRLRPKHHGSYIFLSNVYAGAGRWEDAEQVRISMKDKGVERSPGWSYIEVEGCAYHFVAGDQCHPQLSQIHAKLEELAIRAKEKGYEPDTGWVLHNIEGEDKEDALGCHSEKLALAFGLLSTAEGADIRIVKNLRVCGDCHSLMKFASKLYQREIILRDIKRFHRFKDGKCSCGDYW